MNELPRLMVITDWSLGPTKLVEKLIQICELGPEVAIQHRHPGVTVRQFYQEARTLMEVCRRHDNPLFINGQLDVAVLLAAHLHLPASGILARDARAHLPPASLISVAVHNPEEARDAEGADIALVSPVFPASSKPDDRRMTLGPAGFERLARAMKCVSFALGGITPETAVKVPAHGYASVRAVLSAEDPGSVARSLLAAGRTR